jgi:hypothetical protein
VSANSNPRRWIVSGRWEGTYRYPRDFAPVPFAASLFEVDGLLTGTTDEIATIGAVRGQALHGQVAGGRKGNHVRFSKLYTPAEMADVYLKEILYQGQLSEDGAVMEGEWTILDKWSGSFVMRRTKSISTGPRHSRWFERADSF